MPTNGFGKNGYTKPLGHQDTAKTKPWKDALHKAICQHEDKDVLRKIAGVVIKNALQGDAASIREIGDRLDGKPKQQTELTGADDGAIQINALTKEQIDRQLAAMLRDPSITALLQPPKD